MYAARAARRSHLIRSRSLLGAYLEFRFRASLSRTISEVPFLTCLRIFCSKCILPLLLKCFHPEFPSKELCGSFVRRPTSQTLFRSSFPNVSSKFPFRKSPPSLSPRNMFRGFLPADYVYLCIHILWRLYRVPEFGYSPSLLRSLSKQPQTLPPNHV